MKVYKPIAYKEKIDYSPSPYKKVSSNVYALVKLGLVENPFIGKDSYDKHIMEGELKCKDATIYVELVSEAHHYNRYKREFLLQHAVKFYDGYILPDDKANIFLNSDLHPEHKEITISVCQERIPKVGRETVKYVAYCKDFETEFERKTRTGLEICRKAEYIKYHEHYGKYIVINIVRPEIMWGTFEEIEQDIESIIRRELKEQDLISFLKNND